MELKKKRVETLTFSAYLFPIEFKEHSGCVRFLRSLGVHGSQGSRLVNGTTSRVNQARGVGVTGSTVMESRWLGGATKHRGTMQGDEVDAIRRGEKPRMFLAGDCSQGHSRAQFLKL